MSESIDWMLCDTKSVDAIEEDPTTNSDLMGSHPIVAWVVGSKEPVVPSGWDATLTLDANSLGEVRRAVAAAPADGATAILYDNEDWSYTPLTEQEMPAASIAYAASQAHSAGLQFIAAPAPDLMKIADPLGSGTEFDKYLAMGIPQAVAASGANVYVIQAQVLETNPARFAAFVHQCAAAARDLNPHIEILAGLSTQPDGKTVTAAELEQCISLTPGGRCGLLDVHPVARAVGAEHDRVPAGDRHAGDRPLRGL